MPGTVKNKAARASGFWQAYFMLTILLIGVTLAFGFAAPFYLASRVLNISRLKHSGDRVLGFAIWLLMRVQPWLQAEVRVDVSRAQGRGCLLVSNHRSHLDAFLLLSRIPGIRIFARRSLFRIPFLGAMMWLSRQIPAGSSDPADLIRGMTGIRERLRDGDVVHVFPEMTRCLPSFEGTRKFLQSPFLVAFRENALVVPVLVEGTDRAWPKGSWKLFSGARGVRVISLAALEPRNFDSADALCAHARSLIEDALLGRALAAPLAHELEAQAHP